MAQPGTPQQQAVRRLRLTMMIFAAVLGLQALWILAPEMVRAAPNRIPANVEAALAAPVARSAASAAAWIGLVRGDLWADSALSYAHLFWRDRRTGTAADPSDDLAEARTAAHRALARAPHDARIWLLLAGLAAWTDPAKRDAAPLLKMSYYLGASEIALTPFRLLVALRSDAIADADLQQLVRGEMRAILTRRPELKPAILAAYRQASPTGRRFAEAALQELDPNFLAAVRAGTPAR